MNVLIAALAPVIVIVLYVYLKDRYERESKRVLLLAFMLGAVLSVILSTLLYVLFDFLFPLDDRFNIAQQFIKAFFVVALIEEFSKYVIVRYFSQPRADFNEPYDGIIHAVMVSMGFATVENLLYAMDGGMQVALLRAFTAVPAHATFAILMGYYLGKAKFSKQRVRWNLTGLLLAILFHGAYDFFLFIHFIPGISTGAFISLFIGLLLARKAMRVHIENSNFKDTNPET